MKTKLSEEVPRLGPPNYWRLGDPHWCHGVFNNIVKFYIDPIDLDKIKDNPDYLINCFPLFD